MFWCDKCKIWEHEKCLTDAIRRDYLKSSPLPSAGKKVRKSLGKHVDINIATNEATGEVTAYIVDKDRKIKQELQDGSVKADEETKSDQDGFKTSIPVKCLKCGAQLK